MEAEDQQERPLPVGGSVVTVDADGPHSRPRVASFDDIGSAIQQELSKDSSVPPAETKKGPDLASRFGPAQEPQQAIEVDEETPEEEAGEPEDGAVAPVDDVEEAEVEAPNPAPVYGRSNRGRVAAIWVATALASGADGI